MLTTRQIVTPVFLAMACALNARAADWPMYRRDASRSAATPEALAFPLELTWSYEPCQRPAPAWPEPGKELHRIDFDYAFHPVVAGGRVYVASSADDTLLVLDVATGEVVWQFTAGGPLRFAPAIADGRACVASDDGWLYCLEATDGKELWRFHGAPAHDQLLGNGRMISRWPLRGGVLVVDGVAYVAAGMWPTEGVYIYALDARTGRELWCNDSSGELYINLPHPGASGFSGVAPQGYLLASGNVLLVNTGRGIPAAYDRRTGKLLYYRLAYALKCGGTRTQIARDLFFNPQNSAFGQMDGGRDARIGEADVIGAPGPRHGTDGMIAYSLADGEKRVRLSTSYFVQVSRDVFYEAGPRGIGAYDRAAFFEARGLPSSGPKWRNEYGRVYAMASTANALLVGGRNELTALRTADGETLWQTATDERVRGLAVADGRLFVATQKGTLSCFAPAAGEGRGAPQRIRAVPQPSESTAALRDRAAAIIRRTGVEAGYALVAGDSAAELATALAQQTELHVIAVVKRREELAQARTRLLEAGLYGSRVAVQLTNGGDTLPYASYFASLVVVSDGVSGVPMNELYRVTRPCGGTLISIGAEPGRDREVLAAGSIPKDEISDDGRSVVRGALPGAGEWRCELADAGRTGVGNETRLHLPLELLWFGGPGPDRLLDRGARTSTPLSVDGRVFVTGQDHVFAFDAYTGRELWRRELKDAGRRSARHSSANFGADDRHVYVAVGDSCFQLDQTTGEATAEYRVPAELTANATVKYRYVIYRSKEEPEEKTGRMEWGYLGVADGVVLGTYRFPRTHQWDVFPRYGNALFALDVNVGSQLWLCHAKQRIPDDHVAVGEGKVFFFDTTPTIEIARASRLGQKAAPEQALIALDLRSGAELWRTADVPSASYTRDRYSHHLQYRDGRVLLGASAAYEAGTGKTLWKQSTRYSRRALLYDDRIIASPHAYDPRTGSKKTVTDPLTGAEAAWRMIRAYGCGPISGCESLLFFRSGVFGVFDLENNGLSTFGGARPGCSITMIPANGLLLATAGSSGCACSYNFQTSFALAPREGKGGAWYVFPRLAASGRIQQLAANLGAPGGRIDDDGRAWQPYPRLGLGVRFEPPAASPLSVLMQQPQWFHSSRRERRIRGTTRRWLYTSGLRGQGTLAVDVAPRTSVSAPPCQASPKIDGTLDDVCWQDVAPVPFAGNAHLHDPEVCLLMRQDPDTLYIALRRQAAQRDGKPVPFVVVERKPDDLGCRDDDMLEIHLTDAARGTAAHFGISAAGAWFEGKRSVPGEDLAPLDLSWNGEWQRAASRSADAWTAEIAIPKKLLAEIGAAAPQLMINVLTRNQSGTGVKQAWLTDPELPFSMCRQSLPIVESPLAPAKERHYTVRLHFVEPDDAAPGARVFDVHVQSRPVLTDFDIVREAGSADTAVVKQFEHVPARDVISVALLAKKGGSAADTLPLVNGIEVFEEPPPPLVPLEADEHTLALLHLDEGEGDVAGDASAGRHHATLESVPRRPTWYAHGSAGGCLLFDGRNADDNADGQGDADGLIWPASPAPDPDAPGFTVECRVRHASLDPRQFYLVCAAGYYFLAKQDRLFVTAKRAGADRWIELLSAPCLRVNVWHHIAFTHDGKSVRIYCDGDEVATCELRGRLMGGGSIVVGHDSDLRPSQIRAFRGLMDEIRISNVARTEFPSGPHRPVDPMPLAARRGTTPTIPPPAK